MASRRYRFLRFDQGVDWRDVNPELLSRVNRLGASLGKVIEVVSGYRTRAKQAELYARYVNSGFQRRYIAAKPGQSNHEKGLAVDLEINGQGIARVVSARTMAKFGLVNPVKGDYPHTELADGAKPPPPPPPRQGAPQPASAQAAPAEPQAPIPDVPIGVAPPTPMPNAATGPPLLAPGSVNAEDFAPRQIAELWNLVARQPNPSPDTLGYAQLAQQAAGGR